MIIETVFAGLGGGIAGRVLYAGYLRINKKKLELKAVKKIRDGELSPDTFIYKGEKVDLTTAERPYPMPTDDPIKDSKSVINPANSKKKQTKKKTKKKNG